jgi:tRNA (cytidine/uridine-2'-O-)-methyltransferase
MSRIRACCAGLLLTSILGCHAETSTTIAKQAVGIGSNRCMYDPLLHIVLYQPEIPYNTGSVGRTCVAVGAKLWLVRPLGFRLDDYYLRRAGLDYWEHLAWEVVDDWPALTARLQGRFWFYTKTAAAAYTSVRFEQGDVFVFGSESQGLPAWMLQAHREQTLRVPIRPEARSLNLSNTVAIASFEALRQWQRDDGPK